MVAFFMPGVGRGTGGQHRRGQPDRDVGDLDRGRLAGQEQGEQEADGDEADGRAGTGQTQGVQPLDPFAGPVADGPAARRLGLDADAQAGGHVLDLPAMGFGQFGGRGLAGQRGRREREDHRGQDDRKHVDDGDVDGGQIGLIGVDDEGEIEHPPGDQLRKAGRAPQGQPAEAHDRDAPEHRPVLELLHEVEVPEARPLLAQEQQVGEQGHEILHVLQGQHRAGIQQHLQHVALGARGSLSANATDKAIGEVPDVVDEGGDHQHGADAVQRPSYRQATHRGDDPRGQLRLGELDGHPGQHQQDEGHREQPVLEAFVEAQPLDQGPALGRVLDLASQADQPLVLGIVAANRGVEQLQQDEDEEEGHHRRGHDDEHGRNVELRRAGLGVQVQVHRGLAHVRGGPGVALGGPAGVLHPLRIH